MSVLRCSNWQVLNRVALGFVVVLVGLLASPATQAQNTPPFPDELPDFYVTRDPVKITLPDGRQVVGGYWSRGTALVRTLADGRLDHGFGRDGVAELITWGGGGYGAALALLGDGRIVVAETNKDHSHVPGCSSYYNDCNLHTVVSRLDAEGRQDTSFNGYGRLVLRVGGPNPGPHEDGFENYVHGVEPQSDGSVLVRDRNGDVMARIRQDGSLDPGTLYPGREHDFVAAVPLYNAELDQYFVSADIGEIAGLDRAWRSHDGWFHAYPTGWTLTPTVPVCRFYGLPEAGLDSHLLSADAQECAALEAEAGRTGWMLESPEVFRVELPDPETGECPVQRAPVFRLWNGRGDSGRVWTTSTLTRDYLIAEKGYVPEGWGSLGVAMCSAPW